MAGDPFEPELAAAAAGVSEPEAVEAIDELLALELVRTTDVPRRFRFRHPLVRRAVYDGAPGGWLLGAHERCATALAGRGASASARAHHVEHAARHGDAAALAVLREAGRAAALRAPASAARWFGAALRLLPDSAPPEQRVELLLARAEAVGATGRLEECRDDLVESIRLVPDELVAVHVRLTVACAGVEHMLGRHAESRARIMAALDTVPDHAAPEAVELMIVLAFDGLFRADFDAMADAAARALAAARPLGGRPQMATAASVLSLARAWGGRSAEAKEIRKEAVALVDAMTEDELAGRIDAPAYLAAAELYLDRYDETIAHAERALAVARATGQQFPTLVPTLGSAYLMRGRLAEAIDVLDGGIEAGRLANNAQDLAWRLHIRSAAAVAAGDLDTALAAAKEAVELTRGLEEENFITAYPGLGLAAALLPSGDPAGAIEVLVGAAGGDELPLIPGGWRAMGHELLTRCHLELGHRDDAARAAALAGPRRRPRACPCRPRGPTGQRRSWRSTPAMRRMRPSGRSPRRPPPSKRGRWWKPPGHGCSQGGRSGEPARARGPRPSSGLRPPPSKPAARRAIATRWNKSCASKVTASTAALDPAWATVAGWRRSATASWRWRGSSSRERPTPRSPRSCS